MWLPGTVVGGEVHHEGTKDTKEESRKKKVTTAGAKRLRSNKVYK